MYITRAEAIDVINAVVDNDIIREEITDALEEIRMILRHEEEDNLSLWGAEDDVTDLFVAKRSDLITDEWNEHCRTLYEKYKMR